MRFLLTDVLGVGAQLCTDREQFEGWIGPKFCYGKEGIGEALHFYACGLLSQTGTDSNPPEVSTWEGQTVLYPHGNRGALPFDLFAASFYLVSRYEEYQPHALDQYQRFPAAASLAHQHNFLHQPVVDQWAIRLKACLQERFP